LPPRSSNGAASSISTRAPFWCAEIAAHKDESRRRLIKGVDIPAPPELKPAFEKIVGEPPDSQHVGPAEKPTLVRVSVNDGVPRWLKLSAAVAGVVGAVFAALAFFFAGGGSERECKTIIGGMVVCGNVYDQRVQQPN
jgi:hypothetical protein